MISGCLRSMQEPATTTTQIDWSKFEVTKTTFQAAVETTVTQKKMECCYYSDCPQSINNTKECACYFNVICPKQNTMPQTTTSMTTSTTSTTTSTTTTTIKSLPTPAKMRILDKWTECKKDLDCTIVNDCCGYDWGRKYPINTWSSVPFENYKTEFCKLKEHRMGCGWSMPKPNFSKCVNGKCALSYGSIIMDDLKDDNFTYSFDWIKNSS